MVKVKVKVMVYWVKIRCVNLGMRRSGMVKVMVWLRYIGLRLGVCLRLIWV